MSGVAMAARPEHTLFDDVGGEPTLDDVLASVWEGLTAGSSTECPVCGSTMHPEYGAHARAVGGRCTDCHSVLT